MPSLSAAPLALALACLIITPAAAQGLLGGLVSGDSPVGNVVSTVTGAAGSIADSVTDTAGDITGSISGDTGATSNTSGPTIRSLRSTRGGVGAGVAGRGGGCRRVRFEHPQADQLRITNVAVQTLKECVQRDVAARAMLEATPALSSALAGQGYELEDFVTFTADESGKVTLYVFDR